MLLLPFLTCDPVTFLIETTCPKMLLLGFLPFESLSNSVLLSLYPHPLNVGLPSRTARVMVGQNAASTDNGRLFLANLFHNLSLQLLFQTSL